MATKTFDIDKEIVRRFAADQVPAPTSFNGSISKDDEMMLHALAAGYKRNYNRASITYYLQGKQMMDQLRQIVGFGFGGWTGVSSALDFACGYGRVTRHLVQEMSPTQVCGSDIYADGVLFCAEQFGVTGIPSSSRPEALDIHETFDLILVSSLFSHLPRGLFQGWLNKLMSLLSDRGMLIFSTHGIELSGQDKLEFVFTPESESRSLPTEDYGSTFVSVNFVAKALREASGSSEIHWRHLAHGHLGFQDLYVVSRNESVDLAALQYDKGFFGHVDYCWLDPDSNLQLGGWAADLGIGDAPVRVRVFVNGELAVEQIPDRDRPDVAELFGSQAALRSGWSCRFAAGWTEPTDWVSVKVVNEQGREHMIALATREAMLAW